MVRINYLTANNSYQDDIVIRFCNQPGVAKTENPNWDVRSLNSGNFIASLKGINSFAIQTRPLDFLSDTVGLRVVSLTQGNFKLLFNEFTGFTYAKDILVWDVYTNTQQSILQNPMYNFSITADPNSQGFNRFKMIFKAEQLFVTAPSIIVTNQQGFGGANVNFAATAYSICSNNVNLNYSVQPGTFFPIGVTNVQATATDGCGNSTTSNFSVTVKDVDAPVINNVTGIVVSADAGKCSSNFVPVTPAASDNSGSVLITGTRNDGAALNASYLKGSTIITWKAVDAANNTSSTTQTISVIDVEAPVITPKAILSLYEPNFSNCSFKISGTEFDPAAQDLCSGVTITNNVTNSNSLSGAVLPIGKSTIVWSATDDAGNTSSSTQIINIASKLTASIPDATAIASGADANSIYLGYTPASTLSYTLSGVASYSWSATPNLSIVGAKNLSTIKVTATNVSTGAYFLSLTVVDRNGCTANSTKDLSVIDIRCSPRGDRIQICSPQNRQQCIAVNNNLLNLLSSGAKLGTCTTTFRARGVNPIEEVAPTVSAYPNPTSGLFIIELKDLKAGAAEIQVIDMLGRVLVDQQLNISQRKEHITLNLANRAAGVYNIRIATQDGVQLAKVVLAK